MPIAIAPQPLTKPAAGVIATSPVIIPLTPPISTACAEDVVPADPHHHRHGGAEVRVEDRRGGRHVGRRIGSPPLKPFQPSHSRPGADRDHQQVVGRVDLSISLQPRPDHRRRHEAGDAGREVDDVATGVVQRAVVAEEAAAPDQERVDRVHERDPQRHERDPGLEVDPPEHRAEHQDRRDRREHELEVDQRRLAGTAGCPIDGMIACPCSSLGSRTGPGLPQKLPKKPCATTRGSACRSPS